jgi:WD40 repeat protein
MFGCENFLKFYSNSISVHILQLDTIPPLFFTGSLDNTVRIWEVASQQQVAELKGHTSNVISVAFDSSGKYLASGEIA